MSETFKFSNLLKRSYIHIIAAKDSEGHWAQFKMFSDGEEDKDVNFFRQNKEVEDNKTKSLCAPNILKSFLIT